jgi:hypothetical protein
MDYKSQIRRIKPFKLKYNEQSKVFELVYHFHWNNLIIDTNEFIYTIKDGEIIDKKIVNIIEQKRSIEELIIKEAESKVYNLYLKTILEKTKKLEEIRNAKHEIVIVDKREGFDIFAFKFQIKGFQDVFWVEYAMNEGFFYNLTWNPLDERIILDNVLDEYEVAEELIKTIRLDILFK